MSFCVFSRKDFDLTIWDQAQAVFERTRHATAILHLASFQAEGEFPANHPGEQVFINSLIHTHVLECWRRFIPGARFLSIGSSCVYPGKAIHLTEDIFLDGEPHASVYAYAAVKRLLCTGVRAYNEDNGTKVEVLGWDPEAQDSTQISTDPAVAFDNSAEGRLVTEDFIIRRMKLIGRGWRRLAAR